MIVETRRKRRLDTRARARSLSLSGLSLSPLPMEKVENSHTKPTYTHNKNITHKKNINNNYLTILAVRPFLCICIPAQPIFLVPPLPLRKRGEDLPSGRTYQRPGTLPSLRHLVRKDLATYRDGPPMSSAFSLPP